MLDAVAKEAMWMTVDGDVLESCQGSVALVAAEMLDVPDVVLGAGVLCGEDELVAGVTARNVGVPSVVAGAEHATRVVVVQQVH